MSIIVLILLLVLLAFAAWFVQSKVPGGALKTIIQIVIVVIAIILCLSAFGVWEAVKDVKVPTVK